MIRRESRPPSRTPIFSESQPTVSAELIPIAILLGLAGAVVLVMAITRLKHGALFVGAMLGAASLAGGYHPVFQPVRTWLAPVQEQRSVIFVGLGAVIFVLALVHVGKLRLNRISIPMLLLLASASYAGMVRIMSGKAEDGLISIVFAFATIMPLAIFMPSLVSEEGGYFRLMRIVGLTAAAWTFGVAVQFVINRNALSRGGFGSLRFQGLLANPQHAAAYLAPTFVTLLALYLHDPLKRLKLFWMCCLGAAGVMVLWTGSRSAAAMSVMGAAFVLYSRLGRSVLLAPLGLGVVFVAFQLLSALGVEILVDRLVSTEDTRSAAWAGMWQQFLENPIFGTGGTEETMFSENSYLLGLASYGIFMGLLLVGVVIVSGFQCFRLFLARSKFDPRGKAVVDLTLAVHTMYFAGAMTEGYMVSRVSSMLMYFAIFSAFAQCLIDEARIARDAEHDDPEWHEESADDNAALEAHEYSDYGESPQHDTRAAG